MVEFKGASQSINHEKKSRNRFGAQLLRRKSWFKQVGVTLFRKDEVEVCWVQYHGKIVPERGNTTTKSLWVGLWNWPLFEQRERKHGELLTCVVPQHGCTLRCSMLCICIEITVCWMANEQKYLKKSDVRVSFLSRVMGDGGPRVRDVTNDLDSV